eukprot:1564748-Alexandrium_andersonii.AAC.1
MAGASARTASSTVTSAGSRRPGSSCRSRSRTAAASPPALAGRAAAGLAATQAPRAAARAP